MSVDPDTARAAATFRTSVLPWDELRAAPALPMVEDFLDRSSVAVLAGDFGTCKTFLSLDLAACVATGVPLIGRETSRARVLYLSGEGTSGLRPRLDAWVEARACLPSWDCLSVSASMPQLTSWEAVEALALVLREDGYGLLVIDTLATASVDLDENSAADMKQVVRMANRLRDAMSAQGGSVLLVHHSTKSGAVVRGSSALEDGVDMVWLATAEAGGTVKLTNRKAKHRPRSAPWRLHLAPVDGVEGGVVLEPAPERATAPTAAPQDREASEPVEVPADRLAHALGVLRGAFGPGSTFTGADGRRTVADGLDVGADTARNLLRDLDAAGSLAVVERNARGWATYRLTD